MRIIILFAENEILVFLLLLSLFFQFDSQLILNLLSFYEKV